MICDFGCHALTANGRPLGHSFLVVQDVQAITKDHI
jgi:hypothetical protein